MRLLYEQGDERVSFPIPEGETFIGRKDYCDLCFPDASVSKTHVRLLRKGKRLALEDAGSRNGTLLNGKNVDRTIELESGDVIQIGKITLEVDLDGAQDRGNRKSKVVVDRNDMSEQPSDEELDRHLSKGRNSRSDSFRDFDDFDRDSRASRRSADRNVRDTLPPARKTTAERPAPRVAEVVRDDDSAGDEERDERADSADGEKKHDSKKSGEKRGSGDRKDDAEEDGEKKGEAAKASGEKKPEGPTIIARFVAVEGPDKGKTFELSANTSTIGSKPENAVAIKGEGVSRYHAEVVREADKWVLKDLGSRNGIFVAGKKVDVHELAPGDEVQIGTIKLKFELEEKKAPGFTLPKDPKELLKDERVKKVLAAVIVVVFVLTVLMPGEPPQQNVAPDVDYKALVAKIVTDLKADKSDLARDSAMKLSRKFADRLVPRELEEIAKIWEDRSKPLAFRWERGQQVFDELKRDGQNDLGPQGLEWVEASSAWIKFNVPWWKKVEEANEAQKEGDKARSASDVPTAKTWYEKSMEAYRIVPKESCFSEIAEQQRRRVKTALFGLMRAEGERRQKEAKTPDEWNRASEALLAALELVDDPPTKQQIKAQIEECAANREGEGLYAQALEIVQLRDPTRYNEALELLKKIDKRARVYPDARGVFDWIGADVKVRQARDEYDAMNIDRAVKLLDEAMAVPSIGADAKKAIKERRERWLQVAKVFEVGRQAYEGPTPDFPKAEKAFQQVIQLETSRTNRYHMFARKYLSFIQESYKQSLEDAFKRGVEALKRSPPDLDDAYSYFQQTLNKANGSKKDQYRRAIEKEVSTQSRKMKWLEKASQAFMRDDVSQYPFIREVTKLLKDFLPAGHEDKQRAGEMFRKVTAHDRVVEKNADEEPK